MLQRFRKFVCETFGHDIEMSSPAPLQTTFICRRCHAHRTYEFVVEDGFMEREFPSGKSDEGSGKSDGV